jgi:ribosomal protein S18 acetylase RimI-like enzyme
MVAVGRSTFTRTPSDYIILGVGVDIRAATTDDDDAIWAVLEPIIRAGDAYALPRDWSRNDTLAYWRSPDHDVFVAVVDGAIVGTYFVCANRLGGGAHVANAGYATARDAQGKGVARTMCEHSLEHARRRGFRAMQFNFVIATNTRAVALWERLGFAIVGTLPGAFAHPTLGDVDAFVMYRSLVP